MAAASSTAAATGASTTTTQSTTAASTGGQEPDPISTVKALVPLLKESLTKLMRVAGEVFNQNADLDNCIKCNEQPGQMLEKCLEEFYAYCDQIEINLKLAVGCQQLVADNMKNTPTPVQGLSKPDSQGGGQGAAPDSQSYGQYLMTIKAQITCAKDVHDSLLSFSKWIMEKQMSQPPPTQPPQPAIT